MARQKFLSIPDNEGTIHPVPDKAIVAGMIQARTDQTFNPVSEKAQSGVQIEQQKVSKVTTPVTFYGVDENGQQHSYTLSELRELLFSTVPGDWNA